MDKPNITEETQIEFRMPSVFYGFLHSTTFLDGIEKDLSTDEILLLFTSCYSLSQSDIDKLLSLDGKRVRVEATNDKMFSICFRA